MFDITKSEQKSQVFVFMTKFIFCELILFTSYILIKYNSLLKRTLAKNEVKQYHSDPKQALYDLGYYDSHRNEKLF